jgi:hypothetical protein
MASINPAILIRDFLDGEFNQNMTRRKTGNFPGKRIRKNDVVIGNTNIGET